MTETVQKVTRLNTGAAWKVKEKKSDKHPGYSGTMNIDGVLYFVDVWVKDTNTGEKFLSMSVKKRDKQEGAAQREVANDDL